MSTQPDITQCEAITAMVNAGMDNDAIDTAFRTMPKGGEMAGVQMYQYDVVVTAVSEWMESRKST